MASILLTTQNNISIVGYEVVSEINGKFSIIWEEKNDTDEKIKLYKQLYDEAGNIDSEKYLIQEGGHRPKLSEISKEEYIIIWDIKSNSNVGYEINSQKFNITGPAGNIITLESEIMLEDFNKEVIGFQDGGFAVYWEDFGVSGYTYSLYGKIFDEHGVATSGAFMIHGAGDNVRKNHNILKLSDDKYMVIWDNYSDYFSNIVAQQYEVNGEIIQDYIVINKESNGIKKNAGGAVLSDDNYMVIWEQKYNNISSIKGQKLDYVGKQIGEKIDITANGKYPKIISLSDNSSVVIWMSTENDNVIKGQKFDSKGDRIGEEIEISSEVDRNATHNIITYENGITVFWSDTQTDGDLVYGQKFDSVFNEIRFSFKPTASSFSQNLTREGILAIGDHVSDIEDPVVLLKTKIISLPEEGVLSKSGEVIKLGDIVGIEGIKYKAYGESCRDEYQDYVDYQIVDSDGYESKIARIEILGKQFNCSPLSHNFVQLVENQEEHINFSSIWYIASMWDNEFYPNEGKNLSIKIEFPEYGEQNTELTKGSLMTRYGALLAKDTIYEINNIKYIANEEACESNYIDYFSYRTVDEIGDESELGVVGIDGRAFHCAPKAKNISISVTDSQAKEINFINYIEYNNSKTALWVSVLNTITLKGTLIDINKELVESHKLYQLNEISYLRNQEECENRHDHFDYADYVVIDDYKISNLASVVINITCEYICPEFPDDIDDTIDKGIIYSIFAGGGLIMGGLIGYLITRNYNSKHEEELVNNIIKDNINKEEDSVSVQLGDISNIENSLSVQPLSEKDEIQNHKNNFYWYSIAATDAVPMVLTLSDHSKEELNLLDYSKEKLNIMLKSNIDVGYSEYLDAITTNSTSKENLAYDNAIEKNSTPILLQNNDQKIEINNQTIWSELEHIVNENQYIGLFSNNSIVEYI